MADQSLIELLTGYAAAPFEYFGYGKRPPPRVGDAAVRSSAGFGFEVPTGADDGGDMRGPTFQRLPGEKPVSPSQTNLLGAPQEDIEARAFTPRTGLEHIPFANTGLGLASYTMAPGVAARRMIEEGINTSIDWLRATHQMDGAKATDLFVRPREGDSADIIENPNSVNVSAPLTPLGLASMGNPISALGRESARGLARGGRPSESYSPSLGDRAIAKYMELRDRNNFNESIVGEGDAKAIREIQSFQPDFKPVDPQRYNTYFEPGRQELKTADDLATGAKGAPRPDNDKYPDYVRLLSDAGKRSSLPGAVGNAAERLDASREARMARAAEQGYTTEAYHGAPAHSRRLSNDFEQFDPSMSRFDSGATWFAEDPKVADLFTTKVNWERKSLDVPAPRSGAGGLMDRITGRQNTRTIEMDTPVISGPGATFPVRLKTRDFVEHDWKVFKAENKDADIDDFLSDKVAEAKRAGRPGIVFRNVEEDGVKPHTQYAVIDPARIRSFNAEFDPAKASSAGTSLLAADAGKRSSLPGMIQGAVENASRSEKVVSAATKYGDRVFRTPVHGMEYDEVAAAIGSSRMDELIRSGQRKTGFVTSAGRFVSREEAARLMKAVDPDFPQTSADSAAIRDSQSRGDRSSGAANASEPLKRPKGFGGPTPE